MRSRTAALCLALALTTSLTAAAVVVPQPAQAQARYSHGMFYDDLAPYGRWVDHPRYGWVWYPTQVRAEWRPYSEGSWEWTDRHGWYWNSYEPFGWATYHYGRWGYDDRYGHIWVPGDEWAPAWVSFRHGNDAIGWAPLPPETLGMTLLALLSGGRTSAHYRYIDLSEPYYRSRWVFVPTRYFNDPRGYSRAYSWRDNDRYWHNTTNVTNYVTVNNYYVNRSIDPRRLESRLGRKIETVRVQETSNRRELQARRDERSVRVFNPRIERDQRQAPPQAARARPDERPVVTVRPEFAAPEERRAGRDGRGQNERDDRNRADRDNRPAVVTPAPSERAAPPQRDRAQDRTGQDRTGQDRTVPNRDEDRRGGQQATTPNRAVPDRAAPERTPPQRTQPASPAPRVVSPPARQQDQQRATPAQRPQPSAPAQRTVQPERNERAPTVQRGQPTKQVAPPVQRAQPTERAAPPQRARPQQATRPDNSNRRQEQPRQQQQQRRGNPDEERGGGRR